MQETIEIKDLAKILVDTFYNRMYSHSVLRDYEKDAIEQGISENTGHKGYYDIRLDNVADWGFKEAAQVWKKLEKEIQNKYKVNIYHDKNLFRNGWYTWQRHKAIKFNNDTLKIMLGSKMMEPRHPKEVSNTVYFTVNSKELWTAIWEEFNNKKNKINNKNHTIKIGNVSYSTQDIVNSIKNKPKVIVNLIEDILKEIPDDIDSYHSTIKPMSKLVVGKLTNHYNETDQTVSGHLAKALYTKLGGDGWDW